MNAMVYSTLPQYRDRLGRSIDSLSQAIALVEESQTHQAKCENQVLDYHSKCPRWSSDSGASVLKPSANAPHSQSDAQSLTLIPEHSDSSNKYSDNDGLKASLANSHSLSLDVLPLNMLPLNMLPRVKDCLNSMDTYVKKLGEARISQYRVIIKLNRFLHDFFVGTNMISHGETSAGAIHRLKKARDIQKVSKPLVAEALKILGDAHLALIEGRDKAPEDSLSGGEDDSLVLWLQNEEFYQELVESKSELEWTLEQSGNTHTHIVKCLDAYRRHDAQTARHEIDEALRLAKLNKIGVKSARVRLVAIQDGLEELIIGYEVGLEDCSPQARREGKVPDYRSKRPHRCSDSSLIVSKSSKYVPHSQLDAQSFILKMESVLMATLSELRGPQLRRKSPYSQGTVDESMQFYGHHQTNRKILKRCISWFQKTITALADTLQYCDNYLLLADQPENSLSSIEIFAFVDEGTSRSSHHGFILSCVLDDLVALRAALQADLSPQVGPRL